ncbi:hypothetical protein PM082_005883 [Marasmius tenuissimus]|nr:hypothetical protein PM082_005883 [Marasmius tenuissimus]
MFKALAILNQNDSLDEPHTRAYNRRGDMLHFCFHNHKYESKYPISRMFPAAPYLSMRTMTLLPTPPSLHYNDRSTRITDSAATRDERQTLPSVQVTYRPNRVYPRSTRPTVTLSGILGHLVALWQFPQTSIKNNEEAVLYEIFLVFIKDSCTCYGSSIMGGF